jgi:hypothetical protein
MSVHNPPLRIGKTQIQTPEDAMKEANLQMKIEDLSITDEYLQKENLKLLLTGNPNAFWNLASTQGITAEMLQAVDEVSETMDGSGMEENPLLDLQLDLHERPLQTKDLSPEARAALKAMKKAPAKSLYTKADIPDLAKACMDPEFDDWDTLVGQVDRRREGFETGSVSLKRRIATNKIKQSNPYPPPKELLEKAAKEEKLRRESSKF